MKISSGDFRFGSMRTTKRLCFKQAVNKKEILLYISNDCRCHEACKTTAKRQKQQKQQKQQLCIHRIHRQPFGGDIGILADSAFIIKIDHVADFNLLSIKLAAGNILYLDRIIDYNDSF